MVNSIEVSPHDPAAAYLALSAYKFNDFTPMILRTADYGASWESAATGIEADHWMRVVREDPATPGLLYAGTEMGLFLSRDFGDSWAKWQLNLPVVPITDLTFRNNDLVASTQGRGFWILDDLSPVQQLTEAAMAADMHLFAPREAVMASFGGGFPGGGGAGSTGANPPSGAQIFFRSPTRPIRSSRSRSLTPAATAVRTYATDPEAAGSEDFSSLPAPEAGLNRLAWDYRHDAIPGVDGYRTFGSLLGRVVAPGDYQIRLAHGDESRTVTLSVSPDPRWSATQSQYEAQERFVADAQQVVRDLYGAVTELAGISEQVEAVVERTEDHPLADSIRASGESLTGAITDWEEALIQRRQQTFQDVINFRNKLDAQILALVGSVDGTEPPLTAGARERWTDLRDEWAAHESALGRGDAARRGGGVQRLPDPERRAADRRPPAGTPGFVGGGPLPPRLRPGCSLLLFAPERLKRSCHP